METVNAAIQTAQRIDWSMAPITWDADGQARQDLFLMQPTDDGPEPVDPEAMRAGIEAAAARPCAEILGNHGREPAGRVMENHMRLAARGRRRVRPRPPARQPPRHRHRGPLDRRPLGLIPKVRQDIAGRNTGNTEKDRRPTEPSHPITWTRMNADWPG